MFLDFVVLSSLRFMKILAFVFFSTGLGASRDKASRGFG